MGRRRRQTPKLLPAKLLRIRQALGKSETEMVGLLKFDQSAARISEYEHGMRQPSLLTLLRYSEISGVLINELVNDEVSELTFPKRKYEQGNQREVRN